jgi:NhaA family Na+:H+ antiporter
MAGVITALAIPVRGDAQGQSPLATLEHALHPAVTFFILPLFAFANAGVGVADLTAEVLFHPVTIGIALGLFVGKQVGILLVTYVARAVAEVQLPAGATAAQYYGTSLLCGVGFTMSLFIGNLTFDGQAFRLLEVKAGVLGGSMLSGIVGYLIIWLSTQGSRQPRNNIG